MDTGRHLHDGLGPALSRGGSRAQGHGGFWIDAGPVTNREFGRFARKTGYVTVAERAPDPADYPGARPELLVPFSSVFVAPPHRVSLAG